MADEHINRVAVEWCSELILQLRTPVTLTFDHEQGNVFDEVSANCFQMGQDFCKIGKVRFCCVDKLSNCVSRSFTIEFAKFVAPLRLPLRKLAYDMFKLFFQLFDGFLNFLALRFWPGSELVRRNGLIVARWGECETHWRAKNDDFLRRCLFVQGREGFRLLGLESLIDGAALCLVIFAVKYCR